MLLPEWPHAGPYPAPCFGSFGIRRILKQLVFIHNYIVQGQRKKEWFPEGSLNPLASSLRLEHLSRLTWLFMSSRSKTAVC